MNSAPEMATTPNTAQPLVSILIRSMDRPTLDRALHAAAAQTWPNMEIVVIAACGGRHRPLPDHIGNTPIRLVIPEQPLQRSDAANCGLDHARGEWLVLLDDDDAMASTHIEMLLAAIRRQPEHRVAYSRSLVMNAEGQPSAESGGPYLPWLRFECGFFQPCSALFARSLIDQGVRFDPRFNILEDMDFWIQCLPLTPFLYVNQASGHYYAESGTSGAGFGVNADSTRTSLALKLLREKWADAVIEAERSFEYRIHHGRDLLRRGQPAAALPLLRAASESAPNQVDAINLYGVALLHTDQPALAQASFERALKLAPNHRLLLENLALAQRAQSVGSTLVR